MKRLVVLAVAVLIGFFGYQVAYPKIFDPTYFNAKVTKDAKPSVTAPSKPAEIPEVATLTPSAPKTDAKESPPAPQIPQPSPTPATAPSAPAPTPTPTVAAAPAMEEPPKKAEDPDEFHAPVFPTLEDMVKNWTAIPKKAFPRQVKLRKGVEFVMSAGHSAVAAGGTVIALDQLSDKLIIAPAENSPARAQVAIDDTDLKENLHQAYETWTVEMTAFRRRQWEARKNAPPPAKDTASTTVVASNEKPQRNPDGAYPILLSSMKSGQVTEVTPTNIKKWGDVVAKKIDGKDYWIVVVDVSVPTLFGLIDSQAEAHIHNGKVEKWLYVKSGEVVP